MCPSWPARREDEAEGRAEQPTRTIVFSTFVRALDLVEARLEGSGIGVVRLDGSMTIEARGQAVRQFARDPHVREPPPIVALCGLLVALAHADPQGVENSAGTGPEGGLFRVLSKQGKGESSKRCHWALPS